MLSSDFYLFLDSCIQWENQEDMVSAVNVDSGCPLCEKSGLASQAQWHYDMYWMNHSIVLEGQSGHFTAKLYKSVLHLKTNMIC